MRRFYLFFHGRQGDEPPVALGSIEAGTLAEAISALQREPDMPADRELAGHWCCSFVDEPPGPAVDEPLVEPSAEQSFAERTDHPPSCQYRFRLSARGKISAAAIVQ